MTRRFKKSFGKKGLADYLVDGIVSLAIAAILVGIVPDAVLGAFNWTGNFMETSGIFDIIGIDVAAGGAGSISDGGLLYITIMVGFLYLVYRMIKGVKSKK